MRDTSGNVITEGFFFIGAQVTIHGHCFRVTGADDKTLRLMEERTAEFPYSDPIRAAELVAGRVEGGTGGLRTTLRENDAQVDPAQASNIEGRYNIEVKCRGLGNELCLFRPNGYATSVDTRRHSLQ